MGKIYLKIPMNKGDLAFGYIAQKDERGNSNIINMKKKINKSNIKIFISIKLGDAKIISVSLRKLKNYLI